MTNNQINYAKHLEDVRHNKRVERQADKTIAENKRHNKKSESLTAENIDLGYANVGLGYSNLGELYRHNAQTEVISSNTLDETTRHNKENEKISSEKNAASVKNPWSAISYYSTKWGSQIAKGYNDIQDAFANSIVSSAANIRKKANSSKNKALSNAKLYSGGIK